MAHRLKEVGAKVIVPVRPRPPAVRKAALCIFLGTSWRLNDIVIVDESQQHLDMLLGATIERLDQLPEQTETVLPERNRPFNRTLTLDPAHPYLSERGLSPALVETFGLGFYAGEKGIMLGRVCIPIHNVEGELVAYAGRWVGPDDTLPEGEEKYKLPKRFQKNLELFNLNRVKHCRHLVVVEGYFGAIRLHGLRVPTVALMGSSLSEAQIALLREHCPALRFVTVMLDAGAEEAAEKVAGRLAWHWPVRLIALPDGTQPDTVAEPEVLALLGRA